MSIIVCRSPEFSDKFHQNFHDLTPWIAQQSQKPQFLINDITLRDGKQALPWWNLWTKEQAANFVSLLADAGVHHAEIGFPAIPGDPETESVAHIVEMNKDRNIALFGLARLVRGDIQTAIQTLKPARYAGVHTFIGTSPEHLKSRGMNQEQIIQMVKELVPMIRDAGMMSQFSAEDATRTVQMHLRQSDPQKWQEQWKFLKDVYHTAVEAGAQKLNLPDTLGFVDSEEYAQLSEEMQREFPDHMITTHTHNDWAQAEESAKIALKKGFAQGLEGTVFGIGERAGNADWVSIVMGILNQKDHPRYTELAQNLLINRNKITEILIAFEAMSGLHQRPVAPGYGYEALVNRSGVHQAEVRKMKSSYLWMNPELFGLKDRPKFDISPLSGKHGVQEVLFSLGIECNEKMAIKMTEFYRMLLSPDISQEDIMAHYPEIDPADIQNLKARSLTTYKEARTLKNNEANTKKWLAETNQIVLDAFFIMDPDYKFGPFRVEKFNFSGEGKENGGGRSYQASVVVNGKEGVASGVGEVGALVNALKKLANEHRFVYHPGKVEAMSDSPDALAEMRARMVDEETGNEVTLFVRDSSTATTHVKAFERGVNQLTTLRRYLEKEAELNKTA